MPIYAWKHTKTGQTIDVWRSFSDYPQPYLIPPDGPGPWERVYQVATRVEGGTTPARGSSSYGRKI